MSEDKNEYVAEDVKEFSDFSLIEHVSQELITKEDQVPATVEEFDTLLDDDFNTARKNILSVLENGEGVLTDMIALARASDHPRAFEVVATIMKQITDTNKELLDLHKKKQEIKLKSGEDTPVQNNTQNNYYVGSVADLQKQLDNDGEDN